MSTHGTTALKQQRKGSVDDSRVDYESRVCDGICLEDLTFKPFEDPQPFQLSENQI